MRHKEKQQNEKCIAEFFSLAQRENVRKFKVAHCEMYLSLLKPCNFQLSPLKGALTNDKGKSLNLSAVKVNRKLKYKIFFYFYTEPTVKLLYYLK